MSTQHIQFAPGQCHRALLALAAWACLCGPFSALAADGARLGAPQVLADHTARLALTNAAPTNYVIQASANLQSWFTAASGRASNGLLVVQHAGASNYPTLFYRSMEASLRPVVVPELNTNFSGVTLVASNGGRFQSYLGDGLLVELVVPAMALPDPAVVSVTLVTNLIGLPFSRGRLAAVYLEPADLLLWGAARLEIQLPWGIDRRELVAYRFQADGARFTGVPSQLLTNRVLIPITELGGYGISLATSQEMAAVFSAVSMPAAVSSSSGLRLAGVDDCQAQDKVVAQQARQQIQAAMDTRSQAIAQQLGILRQQAFLGYETDSSATLEQAAAGNCEAYQDLIAPRWPEAQQNCALGQVLSQFTLGLERQRQLLGVSDAQGCTSLSIVSDCGVMRNCLQEVHDCCATTKGPAKVAQVFGFARQDQMLGSGCLSPEAVQDALQQCSSNMWVGTFQALETGTQTTTPFPGEVDVDEYNIEFNGSVAESFETDYGAAGKIIDIVAVGNYSGRAYSAQTISTSSSCVNGGTSSSFSLRANEEVASTDSRFLINIQLNVDGTYSIFAGHMHTPEMPFVTSQGYNLDYFRSVGCDGGVYMQNSQIPHESIFYGPILPRTNGQSPTNEVTGTFTTPDPEATPPSTMRFNWSFRRVSGLGR